jgi:hypothetical protein
MKIKIYNRKIFCQKKRIIINKNKCKVIWNKILIIFSLKTIKYYRIVSLPQFMNASALKYIFPNLIPHPLHNTMKFKKMILILIKMKKLMRIIIRSEKVK